MKTRKKNVAVTFHEIATTELVEIEDLDAPYPPVKDRFVKVCPRIKLSSKSSFDSAAISQELQELGARSVVIAPIVISDSFKPSEKNTPEKTTIEIVKQWFGEQKVSREERTKMIELLLGFMESEGL